MLKPTLIHREIHESDAVAGFGTCLYKQQESCAQNTARSEGSRLHPSD